MDRRVLDVARFEFRSFLDIKGELLGISILVLIALIRFGGEALMALSTPGDLTVAVESTAYELPPALASSRFRFVLVEPDAREESLGRLRVGGLDGLLVQEELARYRLYTNGGVRWHEALADSFTPMHRWLIARHTGLSDADLQAIIAQPNLVSYEMSGAIEADRSAMQGASVSVMVLTIIGVISALSMIIQGIAGEKFGRISEIILSAITPSVWIDGKLIAASMHGIKAILLYAVYGVAAAYLLGIVDAEQLLDVLNAWPQLLTALVIGTVGLVFWSVAFALVAAFLPGATSPIRNTLILVPMTCLLLCLSGAKEPDNAFVIALSFFPPTMPFALPLRMMSDTAAAWEAVLSIVLVLSSTWWLRGLVIKTFADAVLGSNGSQEAGAAGSGSRRRWFACLRAKRGK